MNRAERNLVFWRSLVGLEKPFPALDTLPEKDLSALIVIDPDLLDTIRTSVGSYQLTQIEVEPGWGCTTLFQHLVKDARDRAMERLVLPIRIDLETLAEREAITSDGLEDEIKRQIIGLLIDNPWEMSLNRDYYFDCINFDSSIDLAGHKARMRAFLFDRPPTQRKLLAQFPWLKETLSVVLNQLLANFRIQTGLYFHFPRDVPAQNIRDLVRSLKTIHESGQVDFAALREVYFCSAPQRMEIGRDFQRPFNVVKYPRYTPAQIYAMLVRRYTPNIPGFRGRNPVGLGAVFAESFLHAAWAEAGSLRDIIDRVQAAMLRRLDCPESRVPFMLEPLETTVPPTAVAEGEGDTAQPPARKKFERKKSSV